MIDMIITRNFDTPKPDNNNVRALLRISDKPENITIEEHISDVEDQLLSGYSDIDNINIEIVILDR